MYFSVKMLHILALRCSGEDSGCCTPKKPCDVGNGNCDSDNDCIGNLKCGIDNCNYTKFPSFGKDDDCCYDPKGKSVN